MRIVLAMIVTGMMTVMVAAGEKETLIPNRLASAKIGEWVVYQLPDGYTQKHMVVERSGEGEDANITIRVDDMRDGKVTHTRELVEIAGQDMAPMPALKDPDTTATLRDEEVTLKGKKFKAIAVDIKKGNDLLRTWYISPDFPVYGLIKRVEDKGTDPSFEAIDFGGQ